MKLMKKILSVIIVMSMLLVPLTVYAVGDYADPYTITAGGASISISVPAETEVWVKADNSNNSVLSVTKATGADYMIMYCRQPNYPAGANNTLSFSMIKEADSFSIYNAGASAITVTMSLSAGDASANLGSIDNPKELTFAPNFFGNLAAMDELSVTAGDEAYYYSITAIEDGIISYSIDCFDADYNPVGWQYCVYEVRHNTDATVEYGDIHHSDDTEPVMYEEWAVKAGDELIVWVNSYDPASPFNAPKATVTSNFSFSPKGSWGCPEEIGTGSYTATVEANSNGYYYSYTATQAGTITVAMKSVDWTYNVNVEKTDGSGIYGDTHWSDDDPVVASESVPVEAGDVVTVFVNTYNPNNGMNPAGSVNWTISFTAGQGGTPDPEIEYTPSDVEITMGTNSYPMDTTLPYTVYAFVPTQTGKYTFTASGNTALVSTNGMWITVTPGADTVNSNTFVWDCTAVGQSIWVAVEGGTDNCDITVTREDIVIKQIPVTVYKNKVTPEAFTFEGDAEALEYVDTLDANADSAVLGTDGYYHLNSADGPILYVDLDDSIMNLVDALSYGQVGAIYYEGDEAVSKTDYNEAFTEYANAADTSTKLYPLTADLIEIYTEVGKSQGWYGSEGWIGGTASDFWMFACYYIPADGGNNHPGPSNPNNGLTQGKPVNGNNGMTQGKPSTGTTAGKPVTSPVTADTGVIIAISALIASLALAVLVKKKLFN